MIVQKLLLETPRPLKTTGIGAHAHTYNKVVSEQEYQREHRATKKIVTQLPTDKAKLKNRAMFYITT